MSIVSITGNREHLFTTESKQWLLNQLPLIIHTLINTYNMAELHHGGAQGSDLWFDTEAKRQNTPTTIHVPFRSQDRTYSEGNKRLYRNAKKTSNVILYSEKYNPQMFFTRNQALVDVCDICVAVVHSTHTKGGAWGTFNKAKQSGKPTLLISPDTQTYTWFNKENLEQNHTNTV